MAENVEFRFSASRQNKEKEEIVREVLGIQPVIIGSFFTLLILSCLLFRYFSLLTCLWAVLVGSIVAYVVICHVPLFPSLLFLYKPRKKPGDNQSTALNICSVCQMLKCQRHRSEISNVDLEPWRNLTLNKAIDTAIEEFLDLLLENYVYHWYREKMSSDERFVDELRTTLRFIFAVIYRRLKKIDIPTLVLDKLIKNALQHLDSYLKVRRKLREILEELGEDMHIALHSRSSELQYQRQLVESLLPFLLPSPAMGSRSTCGLFRELLVYAVFTTGIDTLVEPDFVNQILLVILDEESMEEPLDPQTDEVEALAEFAKPRGRTPFHALHSTMPQIINTPSVLFRFIKFMKSQASLNILQFCLSLDDFNKRSLVPDLTEDDKKELLKEAKSIYNKYFVRGAPDFIPFHPSIVDSLKKVVQSTSDQITKPEMATPLYKAYEHAFDQLEHIYLPLFHQSDEYFNMICGNRDSEKPTMKPTPRTQKKKFGEPIGKKLVKGFKDKLSLPKAQEGHFKMIEDDPFDIIIDEASDAMLDPIDIDEALELPDTMLTVRDMSDWIISIPKVAFNHHGSKEMVSYIISVCESESNENMNRWDVKRQHHEFYVLHSKLREFHGYFGGAGLPSKRNSTLSSKQATEIFEKYRNSFKQYLQDLVRNPLTRGSALLFRFLSPDKEFTNMFTPDTVGQVAGKKLKSVATKLRTKKEKGQNLETFLHSFLASTKPPSGRSTPVSGSPNMQRKEYRGQTAQGTGNKDGTPDTKDIRKKFKRKTSKESQDANVKPSPILQLNGVTEYILYIAIHLFEVPAWCLNLLICFRIVGQRTFDDFVDRYLAYKIRLALHEYHFVPVIQMFRDAVFFDNDPPRTETDKMERRDKTLRQLLGFFPTPLVKLLGKQKYNEGLTAIFELLQYEQLNKQLAYTLLDTLIVEIFPEIEQQNTKDEEEK
ncbi:sorting nexin-14-like isoform X2 [Dendronephthya gigantea]|uniref:sorting nexin-14-like isoform X2 n=1 Tax=Dendronephthya gigantea TaxID=151771 RepID=UPI00106CB56D|nr:sorting nexin-14-like isoform X2 [Dendronephthya gigantea]